MTHRHPTFLLFTVIAGAGLPPARAVAATVLRGPEINPANGHSYYLLTSDNWEQSQAAGELLGGHLVTINDQAENDWVFATFSMHGGSSRTLWTGFRRTDGNSPFLWVSGETPAFTNWFPGEPNNATGTEYYAAFVPPAQDPAGRQWFDMFASTTYFGGPIHGVVEVVAPVPESCTAVFGALGGAFAFYRRRRVP